MKAVQDTDPTKFIACQSTGLAPSAEYLGKRIWDPERNEMFTVGYRDGKRITERVTLLDGSEAPDICRHCQASSWPTKAEQAQGVKKPSCNPQTHIVLWLPLQTNHEGQEFGGHLVVGYHGGKGVVGALKGKRAGSLGCRKLGSSAIPSVSSHFNTPLRKTREMVMALEGIPSRQVQFIVGFSKTEITEESYKEVTRAKSMAGKRVNPMWTALLEDESNTHVIVAIPTFSAFPQGKMVDVGSLAPVKRVRLTVVKDKSKKQDGSPASRPVPFSYVVTGEEENEVAEYSRELGYRNPEVYLSESEIYQYLTGLQEYVDVDFRNYDMQPELHAETEDALNLLPMQLEGSEGVAEAAISPPTDLGIPGVVGEGDIGEDIDELDL